MNYELSFQPLGAGLVALAAIVSAMIEKPRATIVGNVSIVVRYTSGADVDQAKMAYFHRIGTDGVHSEFE
jgi:hypothetical protein